MEQIIKALKRERKFRIWLPSEKKMTHCHAIEELMTWNVQDWWYKDTAIFMEFIGWKDDDGKEVYEGDIIDYERDRDKQGDVVKFTEVVTFEQWGDVNGYRVLGGNFRKKIIGNVFENPELL